MAAETLKPFEFRGMAIKPRPGEDKSEAIQRSELEIEASRYLADGNGRVPAHLQKYLHPQVTTPGVDSKGRMQLHTRPASTATHLPKRGLDDQILEATNFPINDWVKGSIKQLHDATETDVFGGNGTRRAIGRGKDRLHGGTVDIEAYEIEDTVYEVGLNKDKTDKRNNGAISILDERAKRDWEISEQASGVSNNWLGNNDARLYTDPLSLKDVNDIRKGQHLPELTQGEAAQKAKKLIQDKKFRSDHRLDEPIDFG